MFKSALVLPFFLLFGFHAEKDTPIPPPPKVITPVVSEGRAKFEDRVVSCAITRDTFQLILEPKAGRDVILEGEKIPNVQYKYILVKTADHREYELGQLKAFHLKSTEKDPTKILEPLNTATLPQLLKEKTRVLFTQKEQLTSKDVEFASPGTIVLILPKPVEPPKEAEKND